ncbi:MAG: hypothetical protein FP825_03230 [Hyphomonas sp.]|uniref:hypothetical protein n=1 Tax=Hyphomonas sp. TaxID=87 RepID=UPI001818DAA2|nr:hypothetical protein [Hyphomonas sp.]MBU3921820.1 hypothetical protein [Alphaproteobacteria bacterium]MBA3067477.1 hypothetical protein [Hyphomonas sp.]MBU4063365.1 hypothetical protein [Alphaproteobacteria bacterium]MBU4165185.1 hypothetical protein [Alphaproteobacteria bacterium]MBU4569605.1 hypothetical protein [Alphaproteobacteria bacterium]
MDCISGPESEWARLKGRPVAVAFHLVEIKQALVFIRSSLPLNADSFDIEAACEDALEALASLSAHLPA